MMIRLKGAPTTASVKLRCSGGLNTDRAKLTSAIVGYDR